MKIAPVVTFSRCIDEVNIFFFTVTRKVGVQKNFKSLNQLNLEPNLNSKPAAAPIHHVIVLVENRVPQVPLFFTFLIPNLYSKNRREKIDRKRGLSKSQNVFSGN